ncbi:hypothetical protein F2Q68_00019526 [Brassica cretica]|uniref:Uncharacterized protein n=1 Tax=Brassica cretica TaxID=69181 RepID=A0A8S9FNV0_BRACR|nr:hypothetical protein F2Q68_00019526 [Brassica cretica]
MFVRAILLGVPLRHLLEERGENRPGTLSSPATTATAVDSEDSYWNSKNSSPASVSISDEMPATTSAAAEEDMMMDTDGFLLARMPSFDPELIWEVLAN